MRFVILSGCCGMGAGEKDFQHLGNFHALQIFTGWLFPADHPEIEYDVSLTESIDAQGFQATQRHDELVATNLF